MDIISHGLWGSLAFGRANKKKFLLAFLCGIGPDLFSFGIFFAATLFGFGRRPNFSSEPPDPALIPSYVARLYNLTHSLVIFAVLFVLVWVIFQRPIMELSAWGLHILLDIPTHAYQFFPTPFLWPISSVKVNGIPWGHPIIFFPNVILLFLCYAWFFIRKKKLFTRARPQTTPPTT